MMKQLLNLTAFFIVFTVFVQANAQADVCDPLWWQQLEVEDLYYNNREININELYETCEDGNTPLAVAYKADVNDEIILYTLRLVGMNAVIIKLFNAENIYGETFPMLFLERYGAGTRLSFNLELHLFIGKAEELMGVTVPPPSLASLCDTLWWQEFESENVSIQSKNIAANDLYGICNDEDTPLMVAYRAGVSDKIITDIFGLAAIHDIEELLNARNADGKSLREMILEQQDSGYKLFPIVNIAPLRVING